MQILAACFRGINDMASNRMKSHNVHSEIVFSFSPNNNVRSYPRLQSPQLGYLYSSRSPSLSVALASLTLLNMSWPSKSAPLLTLLLKLSPSICSRTLRAIKSRLQMLRLLNWLIRRDFARFTNSIFNPRRVLQTALVRVFLRSRNSRLLSLALWRSKVHELRSVFPVTIDLAQSTRFHEHHVLQVTGPTGCSSRSLADKIRPATFRLCAKVRRGISVQLAIYATPIRRFAIYQGLQ